MGLNSANVSSVVSEIFEISSKLSNAHVPTMGFVGFSGILDGPKIDLAGQRFRTNASHRNSFHEGGGLTRSSNHSSQLLRQPGDFFIVAHNGCDKELVADYQRKHRLLRDAPLFSHPTNIRLWDLPQVQLKRMRAPIPLVTPKIEHGHFSGMDSPHFFKFGEFDHGHNLLVERGHKNRKARCGHIMHIYCLP